MAKDISGYQWNIGKAKYVTMDQLWDWSKVYGIDTDRGSYLGVDKRINFENF